MMKFLSNNLLMFVLATVLSVSPLQTIAASVSKCMHMDQSMHHSMSRSESKSDKQQNCCEQNACDMTHCAASTVAAVITSVTQNDMTHTVSNIYLKPRDSIIQFYPSSLYRPPKV